MALSIRICEHSSQIEVLRHCVTDRSSGLGRPCGGSCKGPCVGNLKSLRGNHVSHPGKWVNSASSWDVDGGSLSRTSRLPRTEQTLNDGSEETVLAVVELVSSCRSRESVISMNFREGCRWCGWYVEAGENCGVREGGSSLVGLVKLDLGFVKAGGLCRDDCDSETEAGGKDASTAGAGRRNSSGVNIGGGRFLRRDGVDAADSIDFLVSLSCGWPSCSLS